MAREMKDSGIAWIGEIPQEWKMSRVGLHYDIILGKMLCTTQPNDDYTLEPYYCAANIHFDGISNEAIKEMWFSVAEKELYRVKQNDLLVVEGGAGAGGCAIVPNLQHDVYIQNSVMIVRPKAEQCSRFLRYLIEHLVKSGYIDVVCNKATIPHFTKDKLANVPIPLSTEQRRIADFLDAECARIDTVIEQTRASIEEYKKLKQSVITEAVTKGIRPGRKMKDSGIEWIGEIPEEWQLFRLKDYYRFEKGKNAAVYTQSYIAEHEGDFPVFSGQTENNGIMGKINTYDYDIDECLFTTTVGAKVMTPNVLRGKFSLSQNCLIMLQTQKCNNRYIYYALFPLFRYAKSLIPSYMQPSLRVSDLNKYSFYAPKYEEQDEIADYLDERCCAIDELIEQKEKMLSDLESYKKSLIFEYVTGKKAVMHV